MTDHITITEDYSLPSKGKIYGKQFDPAIKLRSMTGEDEMKRLSPSIPTRERIQAVTVVPMFEPIITPTVWLRLIIPELTRPTSITVMADDD